VASLIPDDRAERSYIYSYVEVLFGRGVNGALVDDYIELLLQATKKNVGIGQGIGHVKHHFYQYSDVGASTGVVLPELQYHRVSATCCSLCCLF
jgi:hypothetical protein